MTKAAAVEPIRTAVESTSSAARPSTSAEASTATKATSPSSAAPPCERPWRTRERECTDQNEDPQRKSRGDAQLSFVFHGRYSLTFRNSIRFASLGSRGTK